MSNGRRHPAQHPESLACYADLTATPWWTNYTSSLVGRTAEREALGFRPSTVADEKSLAE
ncbi:hypothetical protein GCM10022295_93240 [Streptomyces osmaniensis]|uniref:Uncharacterized protein n=1 Tax=Streptomyces osmaniensis TaxID=593134 RepID=A0ABP6Z634_9ACTN|nr:hypothetical protein KJK32_45195 [Streptomyces sp. JCM17656]